MRFVFFTILALILPAAASAQFTIGTVGDTVGSTFTLTALPQYPTPFSKTTLSFLSDSLDLTNATLSVSADGKKVYEGSVRPVAVTLGRAGSVTSIVATISSGGATYNQSLLVQPQDVAIIAEPISSLPPLYRGKSLVPLEGSVRVVAVANLKNASGKTVDPVTLSYAWEVDGTQIANSSGIGKMVIMVASPLQYRSRSITVTARSSDGSLVGGDTLTLTALEPSVRIYENDSLLGIRFDHALSGGFSIGEAESTLYAAPYSLPTTVGAPLVQWFLNGTVAQTGNSITLKPTGSGQGSASLSLVASVGDSVRATMILPLTFGAKSGSNFFGL